MADIFISYSSEDRDRVIPIVNGLQKQGWSVWYDRTIPPGKTFDQVIEEAITAAKCIIVLWSKNSIKSEWVKEEATRGKRRQTLVPALIDPVEPPLGFGLIQAADLTNWKGEPNHEGFLQLTEALTGLIGQQEEPLAAAGRPKDLHQKSEEKEHAKPTPPENRTAEVQTPEPELNAIASTESTSPKPHKKPVALTFLKVAISVALIIAAIWWVIPKIIPSKGKIFVDVVPGNANIQILDVNQPFRQGMELKPGKYQVQVSLQDYEKQDRWIELNANEKKRINFELKKIVPKIGRLFVETNPGNAAVRILDNQEKFNQGMSLKPGRYNLEASLDGYEAQQQVVEIRPGEDERVNFRLTKLPPKVAMLYVEAIPKNANVRILNPTSKYYQGVELKPGRYQLEISADGYETQIQWIELTPGAEKRFRFELKRNLPCSKQTARRIKLRSSPALVSIEVLRSIFANYGFTWSFQFKGKSNPDTFYGTFRNSFEKHGEVVADCSTGLMWQRSTYGPYTPKQVNDYIKQLNASRFAGYSNWRVPTVEELASLTQADGVPTQFLVAHVQLHLDPNFFDGRHYFCMSSDRVSPADFNGEAVFSITWAGPGYLGFLPLTATYPVKAVRTIE